MDIQMIFFGIDNGLNGGIAAINSLQKVEVLRTMPVIKGKTKTQYDIKGIVDVFQNTRYHPSMMFVVLEKAHPRPISGKRQCFTTGYGYGVIQGVLETLGISYGIVNPSEWQKDILKGLKGETKERSIMFCKRKYPSIDFTPTKRSTKPHDGMTDALCMAIYCYRLNR